MTAKQRLWYPDYFLHEVSSSVMQSFLPGNIRKAAADKLNISTLGSTWYHSNISRCRGNLAPGFVEPLQ
jgi:hypothetical protein